MKTSTKIALAAALLGTLGLGGLTQIVDADQPQAASTQHNSSTQTSVLKVGSTGEAVRQAQEILQEEGFYKGPINETFSAEMESAVIAFQKSEHIKPTGVIDAATHAAIVDAEQPQAEASQHNSSTQTSVLKVGSTGEAVRQAQEILQEEGFYKGPINETFSAEMESAVIAFQKSEHIKPTGVIDAATYAAMD